MRKEKLLLLGLSLGFITACGPASTSEKSEIVRGTENTEASKSNEQAINTLSDAEKAEGWELLFDGQTTNGWHSYLKGNPEGWQVREGILHTPGKQGDIVTDKEYENFEVVVEWKIEEQGNSGIFYHVVEDPDYPRMHETGPEFQIIDDQNYPQELTESQKTGANSDVKAPTVAASNPPGEWNHTRINVNQGKVGFWLNGKKIIDYDMESPEWQELVAKSKFAPMDYAKVRKGHIGLQDHGGPVAFKNIKIKAL